MPLVAASLALLAALAASPLTFAQPAPAGDPAAGGNDAPSMYFNVHVGRMLPYGIYGVRTIIPYWGVRFGHVFGEATLEWTLHMTSGEGIRYYDASLSFAFPSEVEGWKFIPFIGPHIHYFQGRTASGPLRGYSTSAGFHLGFSPLIEFGKSIALRADFKFNFNPGQSLHVGGGLQYSF